MKKTLYILFSLLLFQSTAQIETEGTDSINNIFWSIDVISVDNDGKVNNYEKFEYYLSEPDRIVILTDDDTTPCIIMNNYIPKECMNPVLRKHLEYPKFAGKGYVFTKEDSLNLKTVTDTIYEVNHSCVEEYYSNKNHKICTVIIADLSILPENKTDEDIFYMKSKTLFYYSDKHNYEFGYYDIQELNGIIVNDNFRLKYEGWWKFGEKHGKWKEYDKTGKLSSIKTYKKGKLIRSKTFK